MRRLVVSTLMLLVMPVRAADPSLGDVVCVKVRPRAQVAGGSATLADVLVFSASDESLRAAVGNQPVAADAGAAAPSILTHEQIERRLHELGVDISRVLIGGAALCRITQSPAVRPGTPVGEAMSGEPPRLAIPGAAPPRTLARVLEERVNQALAALGGTAEIEFEQAGRPYLELTTPPWDFAIEPKGRSKLGLCEFHVALRRDGKTQRTVNVCAHVRLSKEVLVARSPLSVGSFVEAKGLGLETRLFEREEEVGIERVEQAVGQQVAKFVAVGQMVRRGDLKAVDLVQRSRPVTLIGAGRNVQVRLVGVALDSGGYGDTVRVRLGDTREPRRLVRGVVTGLGTVRLEEEQS